MIGNKTAHTKLEYYSSTDLEALRKTKKSLSGQLVSQLTLKTQQLSYKNPEHYCFSHPAGSQSILKFLSFIEKEGETYIISP
jgi:hypothetical protein